MHRTALRADILRRDREGIELLEHVLECRLRIRGETHPDTLCCMSHLGVLYSGGVHAAGTAGGGEQPPQSRAVPTSSDGDTVNQFADHNRRILHSTLKGQEFSTDIDMIIFFFFELK